MATEVAVRRPGLDVDRARGLLQEYGVYAAVVILLLVNAAWTDNFLTTSNMRVQVEQMVPVLVVALGMALVIGTEGIDLSVGAVIALGSAAIPLYVGYGAGLAIVAAIVVGALAGLANGLMIAFAGVQPIVATLALMIGLRGLAVIINGASAKSVLNPFIDDIGTGQWLGIPQMAYYGAALVVIVAFLVRRTTFGRQLVAIGDNRAASRLAGLPVRRVLITVYVLSGLFAAIAGVMLVGYGSYADPSNLGLNYELSAITAVVVGGTPLSGGKVRVIGTVAGAILMQLISATLIQHDIKASYEQMVEAAIIIVAVYVARGRSGR
ncbi:MAG TPA: ABC transporter permease [Jatrophihabitans sp.]|nr:ABC transporter permease [Jatrophihabitans sp.]